jgi:hypothetical protein
MPKVARSTGEGQAPLEDRPHSLMEDQARPKQLQRALGKGPLLQTYAQRHLLAQIEVRSRFGLLVGYSLIDLQEQRCG